MQVKSELKNFYNEKVKAAMIKARADFIENDEKNSKYFLAIEKRNYSLKCIKCLKTNSVQLCDEGKILKEEMTYYKQFYSENEQNVNSNQAENTFLENNEIPKITQDNKILCNREISLEECTKN